MRAAWTTGYGGDGSPSLDTSRLRVVNGENDVASDASALNPIFGFTAADCPDPDQCLRDDGSGWILVRVADLAEPDISSADHCWFDRVSCSASEIRLEPSWVEPDSGAAFALAANADWVARTTRRP